MRNKITYKLIALCGFLWAATPLLSQSGEALFKAKCNVCHMPDKNSTGPMLKGVKQKWSDAGESDLLYKWIENPQALITSGKSKMANEVKNFSPSSMTPQPISTAEMDAILDYADAYVKPEPVVTTSEALSPVVKIVPNYKENLKLFYWLITAMIALLLAIVMVASSIISFVKSDYFREKLKAKEAKNNNSLMAIALLFAAFGWTAFTNQSYALSFSAPGSSEEPVVWLLVEKADLYVLAAINLMLVGVLFYLKRLFMSFMYLVNPPKEKAMAPQQVTRKWKKVLVDAVPIEKEQEILMHHEYDGIRELDNNLPPWWVWGFYATIIFAVIYLFNYHVLQLGDLQVESYNKEMVSAQKEINAYLDKMAMNVDETNATLMTEQDDLNAGKSIFEANCVTCHNPKGEGNIGPNLTDKAWIYGFDIKELFKTVKQGTANGMPEHASKLNPVQIQQVSSFILSLPETAGKEAQGTIIRQ